MPPYCSSSDVVHGRAAEEQEAVNALATLTRTVCLLQAEADTGWMVNVIASLNGNCHPLQLQVESINLWHRCPLEGLGCDPPENEV